MIARTKRRGNPLRKAMIGAPSQINGGASVSVRWVNQDVNENPPYGGAVTHHIVSNDGTSFDTGLLGGNQSSTKALTAAGNYPYHCAIHPNMVGTITVTP